VIERLAKRQATETRAQNDDMPILCFHLGDSFEVRGEQGEMYKSLIARQQIILQPNRTPEIYPWPFQRICFQVRKD